MPVQVGEGKVSPPATFVCDDAQSKHGECVGAPYSPAQRPGRPGLQGLVFALTT